MTHADRDRADALPGSSEPGAERGVPTDETYAASEPFIPGEPVPPRGAQPAQQMASETDRDLDARPDPSDLDARPDPSDLDARPDPSDLDARPEPSVHLLGSEELEGVVARWREIQAGFVDEPRRAVQDADDLVTELMERITQMLASEREQLESRWRVGEDVSTEDLRQGLRRYRSFFERLLAA
jgi:hypothetical protein